MSKKKTWRDVAEGDSVELGGKTYVVEKRKKLDKKRARVKVSHGGRTFESKVKLDDRVKVVDNPVQARDGSQRRWATRSELDAAMRPAIGTGNPAQRKPPAKPEGDRWDKARGVVEKRVRDLLSARLVAETKDEAEGYYVPPVTTPTVASHLALMHGGIPEACDDDEARMMEVHARQHVAALEGAPLPVNHWHTEKRP